jgi:hypothetical protein
MTSTAMTASEIHDVVFISASPSSGLALKEHTINLDDHWSETDNVQRWKQTQRQRKHQLDAVLVCAFFRKLPSFGTRRLGVNAQRFADAGTKSIRLRQH